MQILELSARTRFKPGERPSVTSLRTWDKNPSMLADHKTLADQVVKFLREAFVTVMYLFPR